jgi:hypothetical protein
MSDGWKLATLKRRHSHLERRLEERQARGDSASSMKYDVREWEALDWAIDTLEPLVPPS